VTLEGQLDPRSSYLLNIKQIDSIVRQRIVAGGHWRGGAVEMFEMLRDVWSSGPKLHSLTLWLSPYLSLTQLASEFGMYTRLSQKFEFSASHRLHNPALSEAENRETYGKCNNPTGHGHNYEVQVTLRGTPNKSGLLVDVPAFERIVNDVVIEKFDHKHLNTDVPEFAELIPSVENIAMVIHGLLRNRFDESGATLASVTVWETSKTWCEYSETK
jgi:6-pyruvoyltetrahydropterin/6-carboxytetrahydropterin synthase